MARQTWDEMKLQYPDEWLMISDYEWDEKGNLKTGIVERHSVDKEYVYRTPSLNKPTAFRYTGESTFSGLPAAPLPYPAKI